jgi:biopolymer transport protein TolQ
MEADISSQAVGLASNVDFSLLSLFIRADIIVKSVIILLIACSIYSWAVIIEKFKLFKKIHQSTEEFETKFWNSKSAETFYNNLPANIEDPMALVFKDAMQNLLKRKSKTDLHSRMTTMLETGIEKQISKLSKGFTFLATVGSTAPFIGLFGTVWGIMNSF